MYLEIKDIREYLIMNKIMDYLSDKPYLFLFLILTGTIMYSLIFFYLLFLLLKI